ncbi:MAG TPA: NnrS family protein, partial [Turneriella sp.]|nr:NnrS family protein [Turneriella sp.]
MSFVERIRSVFRFNHPLWAGAFRPLFFLSAVFGMSTLLLWPFMYFKGLGSPGQVNTMSLVESHGYQMLVGFILAALAG